AARGAGGRTREAAQGGRETGIGSRRAGAKSARVELRAVAAEVVSGYAVDPALVDQRLECGTGGARLERSLAEQPLGVQQVVERGGGAGGVRLDTALAHPLVRDDVGRGAPAAVVVVGVDRRDVAAEDREGARLGGGFRAGLERGHRRGHEGLPRLSV